MNLYMLIPIVVGIICAIFGYLIGRLDRKDNSDNTDYTKRISKLEADLDACKKSKSSVNTARSFAALSSFNAALAKEVFGKKIKENDLTVVEGIGPKISQLFHNHNVKTWKNLSECSVDKCKEVLKSGGDRFKMHIPDTWPKQAKLASEGKWKELLKWQDELDGGK